MDNLITFGLSVFMGFFAIMNPIANTPIFLGLTEGENKGDKKKIAKTASVTAFIIVVAFIIAGKYIFELFGITIPAFKITGGILIFYVGFEMLMSQKSKIHSTNSEENSSIAISPLAIPILAGPGTIVTAMNFVTDANYIHIGIVITSSSFLNSAIKLAESNDIELWEKNKLMKFLAGDVSFSEIDTSNE